MFTSILSAIAAIPALLSSIKELLSYFKKADEEKWFQRSSIVFEELKSAKTDEEKLNAVKNIQRLISS